VRKVLLHWWCNSSWGLQKLQGETTVLREKSTIWRLDSTYKCVKHIGYRDSCGRWIALRCVLLSILDQVKCINVTLLTFQKEGRVLYAKIIPNDNAEHILSALKLILHGRSKDAPFVEVIYTDNVTRDKPGIQRIFQEMGLPVKRVIKI
jgi:hypothetical protein